MISGPVLTACRHIIAAEEAGDADAELDWLLTLDVLTGSTAASARCLAEARRILRDRATDGTGGAPPGWQRRRRRPTPPSSGGRGSADAADRALFWISDIAPGDGCSIPTFAVGTGTPEDDR